MAATLNALQFFEVRGLTSSENEPFGERAEFNSFGLTGRIHKTLTLVADNYQEETLWQTGQGGITTFLLAFIRSDKDILIEVRNDDGTPEFALLEAKADIIAVFGGVCSGGTATSFQGDGTINTQDTHQADIDRIQVKRNVADGVGDAIVKLMLVF